MTTTPADLILIESQTATFHCTADGHPVPHITWSKNGETVGTGETLRFEIQRKDSGKYWCTADNGFNKTVNASAYLKALCKRICLFLIKGIVELCRHSVLRNLDFHFNSSPVTHTLKKRSKNL